MTGLFIEVHRLAAAEKLRRHVRGCEICKDHPHLCVFRQVLEKKRSIRNGVPAKSARAPRPSVRADA